MKMQPECGMHGKTDRLPCSCAEQEWRREWLTFVLGPQEAANDYLSTLTQPCKFPVFQPVHTLCRGL